MTLNSITIDLFFSLIENSVNNTVISQKVHDLFNIMLLNKNWEIFSIKNFFSDNFSQNSRVGTTIFLQAQEFSLQLQNSTNISKKVEILKILDSKHPLPKNFWNINLSKESDTSINHTSHIIEIVGYIVFICVLFYCGKLYLTTSASDTTTRMNVTTQTDIQSKGIDSDSVTQVNTISTAVQTDTISTDAAVQTDTLQFSQDIVANKRIDALTTVAKQLAEDQQTYLSFLRHTAACLDNYMEIIMKLKANPKYVYTPADRELFEQAEEFMKTIIVPLLQSKGLF